MSYNDLASYAASLQDALTRPYPPYEAIGIRDGDTYRQLATSLLQIENEFYSTIRPKRVILSGRTAAARAARAGRASTWKCAPWTSTLSVPIGITADTIRFLDVFLLHCLLTESPPDTPQEIEANGRNKQQVAARGRERGLRLERNGGRIELREWAEQVLTECEPIAAALDAAHGGSAYRERCPGPSVPWTMRTCCRPRGSWARWRSATTALTGASRSRARSSIGPRSRAQRSPPKSKRGSPECRGVDRRAAQDRGNRRVTVRSVPAALSLEGTARGRLNARGHEAPRVRRVNPGEAGVPRCLVAATYNPAACTSTTSTTSCRPN